MFSTLCLGFFSLPHPRMCVLACVECDWSDNDAQERLFRGIVTELKESASRSLKSWINNFQDMIDNSFFYVFN